MTMNGWQKGKQDPGMRKKEGANAPYVFTHHAEMKMRQYGLSRSRVIRVIRAPKRREEGVAERTIAVMQPPSTRRVDGKETWSQEIWVMYQTKTQNEKRSARESDGDVQRFGKALSGRQLRIISAWRYPGVSPKGNPIPEEIFREIESGEIFGLDSSD